MDLTYFQPKNKSKIYLFCNFLVISKISKINPKYTFFVISWSSLRLSIFFDWFMKKRIHNTFKIRWEKTQRKQDSLKTMLTLSIFVQIGSCCLNQNHILKKQNAFRESFTYFPVIKNTIKWIAFKNAYKSSMIFQYIFICQHSCWISVLCAHFL